MKNALLLCVLLPLTLVSCEPEPACVDGAQVACACPGGFQGVQVCEDSRFGPCDCPDDATDAAAVDAQNVDVRTNADSSAADALLVDAAAPDGPACIELGYFCDHGGVCCAGACDGWRCCRDLGGQCVSDFDCCDSTYNFCNPSGVCEARACQAGNPGEYCDYVDLPCCDNRLTCRTTPDDPGYARCCAPLNTILPANESNLCCNSTLLNSDGSVTCYDGQ